MLTCQVLPPREQGKYHNISKDKKERENVKCMLEAVKTGELLPLISMKSTFIACTFNGKTAAGDQRRDFLTFREVGHIMQEYEHYVTHEYIRIRV